MSVRKGRKRTARGFAFVATAVAVTMLAAGPAGADVRRVSGNAFVLRAQGTILGINVNIPNQPLASLNSPTATTVGSTTSDHKTVASVSIAGPFFFSPPTLTLTALDAKTSGTTGPGGSSTSSSDVATVGGTIINANAVHTDCTADATGFHSNAGADNVNILGINLPSDRYSTPNNTLTIGSLTVTFNEIVNNSDPGPNPRRVAGHVNFLHVKSTGGLLGVFDIVIGHSHCDVVNRPSAS